MVLLAHTHFIESQFGAHVIHILSFVGDGLCACVRVCMCVCLRETTAPTDIGSMGLECKKVEK